MKKSVLIPVSLCQYCLRHKLTRQLQLYITLKMVSSGRLILTSTKKKEIASIMNVSVRTVETHLHNICKINWIGKKGRIYYIRSFSTVIKRLNLVNSKRVLFTSQDMKYFKNFTIGAFICNMVNHQTRKLKFEKKRAGKRFTIKGENTSIFPASLYSIPFANSIISKILECSMSTSFQYKKAASQSNYIILTPNFKILSHQTSKLTYYRKGYRDNAHRIHIRRIKNKNGIYRYKVVYILPDLVESNMIFKNRIKLKK